MNQKPSQAKANLGADDRLAEVGHEPDERRVPLVGDLGEGCASRRHEHLPDAVLERPDGGVVHPKERLRKNGRKKKLNIQKKTWSIRSDR